VGWGQTVGGSILFVTITPKKTRQEQVSAGCVFTAAGSGNNAVNLPYLVRGELGRELS